MVCCFLKECTYFLSCEEGQVPGGTWWGVIKEAGVCYRGVAGEELLGEDVSDLVM